MVVSPHLDDAALSCGGLLARAAAAGGAPIVVTVFSSGPEPGAALSEIAQRVHARWGGGDVWTRRRAEDRAACERLRVEARRLDHPDALYRPGYRQPEQLGAIQDSDRAMQARIASQLVELWALRGRPAVLLPLAAGGAVGRHVDHLLCFELGPALRAAGADVRYYEDLPYAIAWPDSLDAQLAAAGTALAPVVEDVTDHFARRLDAIACYASQLEMIFGQLGPFREVIARHAASLLPSRYGERHWAAPDLAASR
jgi:LmbE family N-acetylglucosaminyl deacetylase